MKSDLASMTKHNVQLPNYSFMIELFFTTHFRTHAEK